MSALGITQSNSLFTSAVTAVPRRNGGQFSEEENSFICTLILHAEKGKFRSVCLGSDREWSSHSYQSHTLLHTVRSLFRSNTRGGGAFWRSTSPQLKALLCVPIVAYLSSHLILLHTLEIRYSQDGRSGCTHTSELSQTKKPTV